MFPFADNDLLLELQARGYNITPLLAQKRKQQLKAADIISIDAARSKN